MSKSIQQLHLCTDAQLTWTISLWKIWMNPYLYSSSFPRWTAKFLWRMRRVLHMVLSWFPPGIKLISLRCFHARVYKINWQWSGFQNKDLFSRTHTEIILDLLAWTSSLRQISAGSVSGRVPHIKGASVFTSRSYTPEDTELTVVVVCANMLALSRVAPTLQPSGSSADQTLGGLSVGSQASVKVINLSNGPIRLQFRRLMAARCRTARAGPSAKRVVAFMHWDERKTSRVTSVVSVVRWKVAYLSKVKRLLLFERQESFYAHCTQRSHYFGI